VRARSLSGSPPFCVSVLIGASGWPECLGKPTAAFGAEATVAEGFAAGFLPPVIPSLGCGPFGTVLVRMLEPVFRLSVGFLRIPVSVFCFSIIFF